MKKIIVALVLAVFAGSAQAAPNLWTLDNVVFEDGGTATGTFLYDADADIYSAISVTTTVGSTLPGEFYQFENPDLNSNATSLFLTAIANPVIGTQAFNMNLDSALTNAGGIVVLATPPPITAFESTCAVDPCIFFQTSDNRAVTSGTVFAQSAPVPEPSSALLFPVGLAIWARALRRRS